MLSPFLCLNLLHLFCPCDFTPRYVLLPAGGDVPVFVEVLKLGSNYVALGMELDYHPLSDTGIAFAGIGGDVEEHSCQYEG